MKFESLLARRYIISQKRHSLLTVCSITIAVALMVMLFTSFTTALGVARDFLYDQQPYHAMFEDVTSEQAAQIRHMVQVRSVELKENPGGGNSYQAMVLFGTYIDNESDFFAQMISHLKLRAKVLPMGGYDGIVTNDGLMELDQINLRGRYHTACYFAMFFIFVIFFALALRLVIDTAFEVSSKERERQFGVLQSVGATPKQIVRILTFEGMILSGIGVPLGVGGGLLLSFAAYKAILSTGVAEAVLTPDQVTKIVHLHINPWMTAAAALVGLAWVFFSAYGTGMRIIRMSPVQAITARAKTVRKVKRHTMLSLLFGWTGKLASRNARRNRKRFIITVLSLTLSLTLFASISSIINLARKGADKLFGGADEFGALSPDFMLEIDMAPDQPVQSPTAFAEGIRMLEDTGYFKDIDHKIRMSGELHDESLSENDRPNLLIYYVNRHTYQRIFSGKPEISYDELTKQGGAIMRTHRYSDLGDRTEITLDIRRCHEISREEYEKRYAEGVEQIKAENPDRYREGELCFAATYAGNAHCIPMDADAYWNRLEIDGGYFYEILDETVTYPVLGSIDRYTDDAYALWEANGDTDWLRDNPSELILTEDTWLGGDWEKFGTNEKWYTGNLFCSLARDEDYPAARQYLLDHRETFNYYTENDSLEDYGYETVDMYAEQKKIRTILSAIHIGLMFVLAMIALIAIVNMVNIVSTGILNRKNELAAMQCVGMTRGQMYRLAAVECLQFTLWAAVAATLLCLLLFFGTVFLMKFIEVIDNAKQFVLALSEPVIKIWLASIFAFFCALAASLIPLRRMQKEPLVEQIRAVE